MSVFMSCLLPFHVMSVVSFPIFHIISYFMSCHILSHVILDILSCHVICHVRDHQMSFHVNLMSVVRSCQLPYQMSCHVRCHIMSDVMSCHVRCRGYNFIFFPTKLSELPFGPIVGFEVVFKQTFIWFGFSYFWYCIGFA